MSVDSYLEMFTTLYGWLFYNIIWDVLVSTGIVLLPFIGIVLDNVIEAYRDFDVEDASSVAQKWIEVDVIVAMMVITVAANPFFSFQASEVSYTPPAILGVVPPAVNADTPGESTFATLSFVGHPASADVPPWWYGVSQLGSGLNRAIMEGVPNVLDFRNYEKAMNTIDISDPLLKAEVNDFYRDCFVPARSKYYRERPSSPAIDALINANGEDDPDWVGSRVFLGTGGYYDSLRAGKSVEPFLYDPLRDVEWDVGVGDVPPVYGKPTCAQWWNGIPGVQGLKGKMVGDLNYWDNLMAVYEAGFADVSIRQDVMLKKLLFSHDDMGVFQPRGYDFAYNNVGLGDGVYDNAAERFVKGFSTFVGSSMMGIFFGMFLDIFLRSAPMIQALFLMGIVMFLPFLLVASRFQLSVLMGGALAWFSVKFWTVLWFIAYWVDQSLIRALFPEPGALTLASHFYDGDAFNNRAILNFCTGMMYLALPVIFTTVLSIAGITVGRQLDAAKSMAIGRMESGAGSVGRVAGGLSRGAGRFARRK